MLSKFITKTLLKIIWESKKCLKHAVNYHSFCGCHPFRFLRSALEAFCV